MSSPPTPGSDGVPPELLEFQTTLRTADGGSALELLKRFDDYCNADAPEVAVVHRGVRLREARGWQLGLDVFVPFGEPPFPVVVYFHGGGWVMGSPWTHRRLTAELAARGLLVLSVDYRRAPKHRFPGAAEDAAFAARWARRHVADYGGDPQRLLVGGDSAGANLAAGVLAVDPRAADAALLCYGIYDFHRALPALAGLLGGAEAESQPYLPPADFERLRGDPRLSPESCAGSFPPTLLVTGDADPLRPESEALARRLAAASVPHQVHLAAGAPHGFLQMPTHPAHDQALAAISAFVRRAAPMPATTEAP